MRQGPDSLEQRWKEKLWKQQPSALVLCGEITVSTSCVISLQQWPQHRAVGHISCCWLSMYRASEGWKVVSQFFMSEDAGNVGKFQSSTTSAGRMSLRVCVCSEHVLGLCILTGSIVTLWLWIFLCSVFFFYLFFYSQCIGLHWLNSGNKTNTVRVGKRSPDKNVCVFNS